MSMEETIRKIVQEELKMVVDEIRELLDTRDLKPMPKYLRVAEAAELLNIAPSTMYQMTRQEGFPKISQGHNKAVVIEYSELQKWLEENKKIS